MRVLIALLLVAIVAVTAQTGKVVIKIGTDQAVIWIDAPLDYMQGSLVCPARGRAGDTLNCTFKLTQPAPAGGYTITATALCTRLDANGNDTGQPCVAQPILAPAIITIPEGSANGGFSVLLPKPQ